MTCIPTTLKDTPKPISLRASGDGLTPCALPDGRTTNPSGPAPVLANRSARQAQAAGLLTSGTYGLTSSISSSSAALADALVSRLRPVTASLGSTLYKLTWKARVTPQQRLIYALRASAPRTSANDCIGWPTPNTGLSPNGHGQRGGSVANGHQSGADLSAVVTLTGWPTPNASDGSGGGQARRVGGPHSSQLSDHVMLVGWPTTSARDWHSASGSPEFLAGRADQTRGKPLSEEAFVQLAGWPSPGASDGNGGKGPRAGVSMTGRLPDGSKATMGLPAAAKLALAGWPSPMAGTPAQNGNSAAGNNDSSRQTVALAGIGPARRTASGAILTGFSAGMESGGQLAPAHSLWLMGFPPEWENFAPQATRSSRRLPPSSSGRT